MAIGLAALLDDIAAFAKLAAASVDDVGAAAGRASVKATGVVIDDTAVTPRYVEGLAAKRELPIIRRIATGSLRNKLLFILPAALLLSEYLPWLLTPLLMLGGTYLAFEGAEKVWEMVSGTHHAAVDDAAAKKAVDEDQVVSSAVRTDFILSAEIMVIALNEVAGEGFWARAIILAIVAVLITALVYGVVAIIVKADDVGLHLAGRETSWVQSFGRGIVRAMPRVMAVISFVGVIAMLWVGGHILLQGAYDLGWHGPYDVLHHLEGLVDGVSGVGGFLTWLVDTAGSAVVGIVVGGVVVAVVHLVQHVRGGRTHA
ncbi:DUF808 domain-containing protein [Cellulosimicrobium arenosum]|uniref:DUF808 domain-containing protein n=1 Tax=Cellulosimicrobium arenosum TaxID=2708133 RepID=A0A927J246_9MICO|nr:DUF808 domain-containing protein [Cellulosimicrobium arenosum]MBD8080400.1 DUF808 domain-containing protein [Cellulosimicrobium arenosum]